MIEESLINLNFPDYALPMTCLTHFLFFFALSRIRTLFRLSKFKRGKGSRF